MWFFRIGFPKQVISTTDTTHPTVANELVQVSMTKPCVKGEICYERRRPRLFFEHFSVLLLIYMATNDPNHLGS